VERALLQSNAALQDADRLKTEFLANVSYELRTPLNTIIGFTEILSNGYFGQLNGRQVEYTGGILEASQRLSALINDILDLSMIEAGQIELDLARFDVQNMMDAIVGLTHEHVRKHNLRLDVRCAPDVGELVGDERRLKQALYNLISNAMNFTPPGGVISVEADRSGHEMRLQVTDTGTGIENAEQKRVFDPFERGRTSDHRPAGAGLGLTLVKRFVEMHGGRVELTSAPGIGTTVRCYVPINGRTVDEAESAAAQ
jgi:signal transduction histidine kinase